MLLNWLSIRSLMCQNDNLRSLESRGMLARLIGFETNAWSVRRCVVSPAAEEMGSKCAPMCKEFGGDSPFRPSAGVLYEQPPTQPGPASPNPPLSVLGQLVAPGRQWQCQSIG